MSNPKKTVAKKTAAPKKQYQGRHILLSNIAVLEQRVDVLAAYNQRLMAVLSQHFPNLAKDFNPLHEEFQQNWAAIEAGGAKMLLMGHGVIGVAAAAAISSEADQKAYEAKQVKEVTAEGDIKPVMEFLEKHLTVRTDKGDVWADVESAGLYDAIIHKDVDLSKIDMLTAADGLYPYRLQSGNGFILRVGIDKNNIAMFTTAEGLSVLTYSPMEEVWIKHNNQNYVDVPVLLANLSDLFSKANVHDISVSEIKRLGKFIPKLGENARADLGVTVEGDVTSVTMAQMFKVVIPAKGEPSIANIRDDLQWTDLSLPTRRLVWRQLVTMIETSVPETPAKA